MTLSARATARLVALAMVTVIVQIAALSQVLFLGVGADVSPLVVMAVGFLAGSVAGALTGFGVGLLVDLTLFQTLGVSSLVLTAVGYGVGRFRELRDPAHALAPLALGVAATAVAQIGFATIQFLLGVDAPLSSVLAWQILGALALGALLALPVHALVRTVLGRDLPDDPRSRRRLRAYTTGGLSPISRP